MNAKIRGRNLILFFAILLMLSGTFLSVIPKNIKASEDIPIVGSDFIGLKSFTSGNKTTYYLNICDNLNSFSNGNYICLIAEPFDLNSHIYQFVKFGSVAKNDLLVDLNIPFNTTVDIQKILANILHINYSSTIKTNLDINNFQFSLFFSESLFVQILWDKGVEIKPDDTIEKDEISVKVNGYDEFGKPLTKYFKAKKGSNVLMIEMYGFKKIPYTKGCLGYDVLKGTLENMQFNSEFNIVYDYETIRVHLQNVSSPTISTPIVTYYDNLTTIINGDKIFGRKVFGYTGYLYDKKGTFTDIQREQVWSNGGTRLIDFKNFDKVEHGINCIYLYPIYDYMLPKDNPDYKEQEKDIFDDVADNISGGLDFIKDIPREIQSFFKTSLIIILVLVGFILIKFIIDIFRRK